MAFYAGSSTVFHWCLAIPSTKYYIKLLEFGNLHSNLHIGRFKDSADLGFYFHSFMVF